MAGVRPRFEKGSPLTFNANVLIKGGQLVEPDGTTGRIKPTAGVSAVCLGVSTGDASAFGYSNANTTDAWGNPIVASPTYPPNEVAVAKHGVWDLEATADIPFGALVVSAAAGKVTAAGATPAVGTVVGQCVEPGGIVFATNPVGKIRLGLGG